MAKFEFAAWPPAPTKEQLEALTLAATTYALSHGLLYLPPTPAQPPAPTSAIHAPVSLFPAPVPRRLFDEAVALQSVYNVLYARIAMDTEFLDRIMGAEVGVGRADEFVGALWKGWKAIREEGVVQSLQLGLFRSDYLLHTEREGEPLSLKQVEFNTISSSFGPLSERSAAMHRYLHASTEYYGLSSHLVANNFPPNNTTAGLAEGLARAHQLYGVPGSRILFVIQPNERNVFDQRWLEYELLETHNIHVVRQTFSQLASSASLSPDRTLRVTGYEISTVYFRAGYVPSDYADASYYQTRFLLERSRAINCPSIPLQLAGGKKVQEALTKPGVLERFLADPGADAGRWGGERYDDAQLRRVKKTWMDMWALDEDDADALSAVSAPPPPSSSPSSSSKAETAGVRRARAQHASLVLKPQREGGGNNVYKSSIPPFLAALPAAEREAWIAMALIIPPARVSSYLVRAGAGGTEGAVRTEVISELGVFGWTLFGGGEVKEERQVGWLVRTKGTESDEGGVAAGFSVLDSIVLVDE